jgi:hypothetical protein
LITVNPVRSPKDFKQFVEFPYRLYKDNRYWIPPLRNSVYELFDRKRNPFWEHADGELYLAYRGRRLVGRIAAVIDRNFIKFWDEPTGYFGFFDCDDDEAASNALFAEVKKFHKANGLTKFIGPMNLSTNDECGVLIEGFYTPPFIMMTHNFEYYNRIIEAAGLVKGRDLYAFYIDLKDAPFDYLERICAIVRRRVQDMKVRHVNLKDFQSEIKMVKEVYNDAWSRNWGFVPMTDAEFNAIAKNLKPLVVPELIIVIELDNEPAAVSLTVPNYNVVLKRLNGRLGPIEMIKFLFYKKTIKEGRLMIMGVRHKFRKMGLESLLFLESFRAGQKLGYTGGELSWILEDNHPVNNAIIKMGGKLYKKYRIYEGAIADGPSVTIDRA